MTWERVVDPPLLWRQRPLNFLVCFAPLLVSTKGGFAPEYSIEWVLLLNNAEGLWNLPYSLVLLLRCKGSQTLAEESNAHVTGARFSRRNLFRTGGIPEIDWSRGLKQLLQQSQLSPSIPQPFSSDLSSLVHWCLWLRNLGPLRGFPLSISDSRYSWLSSGDI